ncbi:unnamed protein product [Rotaria sordida]|uniref:mitogen-activated protein kinase kinase n=1 Tax=Rotaria sordida TaxID=392033 RepID=A0A815VRU3_9BILA|nr:unnamed protein product [Rotaria sordida]
MSSTTNGSSRSAKRRKLRLIFADIKDSCTIQYNGESIQFNSKQLINITKLGEGNFASVFLTKLEHRPDVIFACKRMTLENHGNNNYSSQSDLKAMRAVGNDHHPHIVDFYAALIDLTDGQLVICMESLETSMDKFYPILHLQFHPTSFLLDLFIRRLAKHIVLGLDYLKSKNLIHRDVKPQNMLVARPLIFKLCDFGICGILKDSVSSTHLGSLRYLPPERLGNVCSYGTRSDMWALGMSLLEISQGYLPLASESIMSFMSQMKNGWQPDLPLTLNQHTRDLLSILLRHDVNERPRYYSDILSMESIISIEENPSIDEINLVNYVIQSLPPKTPE